jgi:hypothetical protein
VRRREKQKPGSCRQRGDLNGVAEVLQTHDEASGVDGFGPLVEVVRAEIAIEFTADQHVVDAGQDRGGERAERLLIIAAASSSDSSRCMAPIWGCDGRSRRILSRAGGPNA